MSALILLGWCGMPAHVLNAVVVTIKWAWCLIRIYLKFPSQLGLPHECVIWRQWGPMRSRLNGKMGTITEFIPGVI